MLNRAVEGPHRRRMIGASAARRSPTAQSGGIAASPLSARAFSLSGRPWAFARGFSAPGCGFGQGALKTGGHGRGDASSKALDAQRHGFASLIGSWQDRLFQNETRQSQIQGISQRDRRISAPVNERSVVGLHACAIRNPMRSPCEGSVPYGAKRRDSMARLTTALDRNIRGITFGASSVADDVDASSRDHGGAEGIRTPDLCHARATLYQLSYSPMITVAA